MSKIYRPKIQKKIIKISFSTLLLILVLIPMNSCNSDRKKRDTKKTKISDTPTVISNTKSAYSIERINFYFENSGSINGYLSGTNFLQTMHEIINDNDPRLNPFFVNTKEYSTSNLLNKIDNRNIATPSIGGSNHKFIFENAIKNADSNNLSIVVTDGIYSMPNNNVGVNVVEVEIKKAFEKALKENAIETIVLKLSSRYKGMYYTESDCNNIKIDQERPYYILLFGNKKTLDNALKNIVHLDELPGFKQQARFFLKDDINVDYTILTQGEEKIGSFKKVRKDGISLVKEIEDAEKNNRGGDKYLQFAIGINYNKLSLPNSYLLDKNNYEINNGYTIENIKAIESLSGNKTLKAVERINKNITISHLITVRAKKNITGELEIQLKNNLPSWIENSGVENDCAIKNNTDQTFAFDKLMNGISRAYSRVNIGDEYFEFKLKIKH